MITALKTRIQNYFVHMNLFYSGSNVEEVIQREKWSTRIYIALFIKTIFILFLLICFGNEAKMVTVKNPSYAMFNALQQQYPDTLQCPCSTISLPYSKFIQIKPKYHQVFIMFLFDPRLSLEKSTL